MILAMFLFYVIAKGKKNIKSFFLRFLNFISKHIAVPQQITINILKDIF